MVTMAAACDFVVTQIKKYVFNIATLYIEQQIWKCIFSTEGHFAYLAAASASFCTMEAFVLNKSSRVIPTHVVTYTHGNVTYSCKWRY